MEPDGPAGTCRTQGPAGPRGPAVPQGLAGPQGPAGPVGPQGDKGDTGPAGPQGATGDIGPAGPPGRRATRVPRATPGQPVTRGQPGRRATPGSGQPDRPARRVQRGPRGAAGPQFVINAVVNTDGTLIASTVPAGTSLTVSPPEYGYSRSGYPTERPGSRRPADTGPDRRAPRRPAADAELTERIRKVHDDDNTCGAPRSPPS